MSRPRKPADKPAAKPEGRPWSKALIDRMQDEAQFDQEAMARFKAEHGGKTPLEVIMDRHPEVRDEIECLRLERHDKKA